MKRFVFIAVLVALMVGCVAKPKPVPVVEQNPRIIERDLSAKRIPISRPVAIAPRIERPMVIPAAIEPQEIEPLRFEIEFVNDSGSALLLGGIDALEQVKAQAVGAESVILIGYSNGVTAVGNSLLASSRADYIATQLEAFGINRDKIKTMASWSPKIKKESPAKGVQVFVKVKPSFEQGKA